MPAAAFTQALLDGRDDIFKLCRILNYTPTGQQADLFREVQYQTFAPVALRSKGVAVKSGQGPGKTSASTVVALFRSLQEIDEQTIVTAPTMRQAQKVWVAELGRTVGKAVPEFTKLVKIDNTKATIMGRPRWGMFTATSTKPENLQGYHSPGMTILVDEASGIGRRIWETIKGTTTGDGNLIVAIGNPNDRNTEFFDMFNKDAALYITMTWSAEDSPNVSKKHIADMEEEYGRESDIFRVRVLGEFPRQDPAAVIRYEDLIYCTEKVPFAKAFRTELEGTGTVRQIGIDLARFGGDESVISARYNGASMGRRVFVKREPLDVIEAAFAWQKELGWQDRHTEYCCDAGGMGQGVMGRFYEENKNIYEFHSQGTPFDEDTYHDSITEAYFNFRRLTRRRLIRLKKDATTFNQLVGRHYRYTDGRFRLESKDEFLKRVGTEEYASPDRADSEVMSFYRTGGSLLVPIAS